MKISELIPWHLDEALAPRPLKPGQSARITGKDPRDTVKKIKDYIHQHRLDANKLEQLERQLSRPEDFGLTPFLVSNIKQEIESLLKSIDPKTHGFDRVIEQVVPVIQSRCSKYLPILLKSEFFLYRGMGQSESKNRLAFRAHSRDFRSPTDSEYDAQLLFDKALKELGFTALRNNSIFTSSDHNITRSYGKEYIIFPTNDVTYTWSEKRADLVLKMKELQLCRHTSMDLAMACRVIVERMDEIQEENNDLTPHMNMTFGHIMKLVMNPASVNPDDVTAQIKTIKENSHSLRDFDEELMDMLYSLRDHALAERAGASAGKFEIDINKFQERFSMSNRQFPMALRSGHEILINGEYIAVLSSFEPMLREALNAK